MEAKLYELESFKSNLFEIPQFQRTYAWRENDWESFWTTIAEAGIHIDLGNPNQLIERQRLLTLRTDTACEEDADSQYRCRR